MSSPVLGAATPAHTDARRKWPLLRRVLSTLGRGMRQDIRARAPHYARDWADGWNYRVVPATCLIFFAKSVSAAPAPRRVCSSERARTACYRGSPSPST
jgi:hypothetical protein